MDLLDTQLYSLLGEPGFARLTAEDAPWAKFREAKIDFVAQNAYGANAKVITTANQMLQTTLSMMQ